MSFNVRFLLFMAVIALLTALSTRGASATPANLAQICSAALSSSSIEPAQWRRGWRRGPRCVWRCPRGRRCRRVCFW